MYSLCLENEDDDAETSAINFNFCLLMLKKSLMINIYNNSNNNDNDDDDDDDDDVHLNVNVICLPTEHQGVHKNSFRTDRAFQDRTGIWKCWFIRTGENRRNQEKNLSEQSREPTTNLTHI